MEEIVSVFAQEAREQLTAMEDGLLRMEQGDIDAETINAIFRAAHTIKGASGVVELHHIEKFTHVLENVLDRLRNGEIEVSGDLITALLQGCDHIGALLDRVDQGHMDADAGLQQAGEVTADALRAFASANRRHRHRRPAWCAEATVGVIERSGGDTAITDCWHISIRFGRDVLKNGMDPLAFLRYLLNLGEIVHLETLCDAMPGRRGHGPGVAATSASKSPCAATPARTRSRTSSTSAATTAICTSCRRTARSPTTSA